MPIPAPAPPVVRPTVQKRAPVKSQPARDKGKGRERTASHAPASDLVDPDLSKTVYAIDHEQIKGRNAYSEAHPAPPGARKAGGKAPLPDARIAPPVCLRPADPQVRIYNGVSQHPLPSTNAFSHSSPLPPLFRCSCTRSKSRTARTSMSSVGSATTRQSMSLLPSVYIRADSPLLTPTFPFGVSQLGPTLDHAGSRSAQQGREKSRVCEDQPPEKADLYVSLWLEPKYASFPADDSSIRTCSVDSVPAGKPVPVWNGVWCELFVARRMAEHFGILGQSAQLIHLAQTVPRETEPYSRPRQTFLPIFSPPRLSLKSS